MPIRETTRYFITCDTCGETVIIEAVTVANELPDGWTSQPGDCTNGAHWRFRTVLCPDCGEKLEEPNE